MHFKGELKIQKIACLKLLWAKFSQQTQMVWQFWSLGSRLMAVVLVSIAWARGQAWPQASHNMIIWRQSTGMSCLGHTYGHSFSCFSPLAWWCLEDPRGWRSGRCLCWLYSAISDGDVGTESRSVSWEDPESLLPVEKGSLDALCILTSISAHPSSFSPLVMKFLTVSSVLLELIFYCCWKYYSNTWEDSLWKFCNPPEEVIKHRTPLDREEGGAVPFAWLCYLFV